MCILVYRVGDGAHRAWTSWLQRGAISLHKTLLHSQAVQTVPQQPLLLQFATGVCRQQGGLRADCVCTWRTAQSWSVSWPVLSLWRGCAQWSVRIVRRGLWEELWWLLIEDIRDTTCPNTAASHHLSSSLYFCALLLYMGFSFLLYYCVCLISRRPCALWTIYTPLRIHWCYKIITLVL